MCKVKTPTYTPPPKYAQEKAPDNAALYDEARAKAAQRSGGAARSTVLSGLQGVTSQARTTQRSTTVLG